LKYKITVKTQTC